MHFFLFLMATTGPADAVPLQLTQQGRILDSTGASINGLHSMHFRIYDDVFSGALLWEEQSNVNFINGYYSTILGGDTQNNPIEDDMLAMYTLYLEIEVDGNGPLTPRTPIYATPYSRVSGVAERQEGGTVDASQISVNGNLVIDSSGAWVGPSLSTNWTDIDNIPGDIADGDDVLSESDVEGFVTNGAIDLAAGSSMNGSPLVTTQTDSDTLLGMSCQDGQLAKWDGGMNSWYCADDLVLSESDVETYISNGAIDLAAGSSMNGSGLLTADNFSVSWGDIQNNPINIVGCGHGNVLVYDSPSGEFSCTSIFDQDGDGYPAWDDCDDTDPGSFDKNMDADCDGILTVDDCDDNNPGSNAVVDDNDCDGVVGSDDCNDNDPGSTTTFNDADCDGTLTADDCNDNDPGSTTTANDADCDGTLTADDCNDNDAGSTTTFNDADCDGTLTADDCNDNDAGSTIIANDADCDTYESGNDCNDNDASINPGATEICGDGVDQNCDGSDSGCSMCGDILHEDPVGGPSGWTLCYIDETDTAYHSTPCRDLLQGIPNYGNYSALLNAGGNFGCWHGTSGSQEGAYYANNNVVNSSCRDNIQQGTQLNAWSTSNTTLGVCIRFP